MTTFIDEELKQGGDMLQELAEKKGKNYGAMVLALVAEIVQLNRQVTLSNDEKAAMLESKFMLPILMLGADIDELLEDANKLYALGVQAVEASNARVKATESVGAQNNNTKGE